MKEIDGTCAEQERQVFEERDKGKQENETAKEQIFHI